MKTAKSQNVLIRVKLAHELLLRSLRKIDDLDGKAFPCSQGDFWKNIHETMQEHFILTNAASTITFHSRRRGGVTRDYILKWLSLPELMDRGRWEKDSTLYNYVKVAKSLIVQVKVREEAKEFLSTLNNNAGLYFNVPEVRAGWEEFVMKI